MEVLKAIEGEGRIFGLPFSYGLYVVYAAMLTLLLFIILETANIISSIYFLGVFIVPLILYVILRIKTKSSSRTMELESWLAYRMLPKIYKSNLMKL